MHDFIILKARHSGATFKFVWIDDLRDFFKTKDGREAVMPGGWHNRCPITGREPAAPRRAAPSLMLRRLTQPNLGSW